MTAARRLLALAPLGDDAAADPFGAVAAAASLAGPGEPVSAVLVGRTVDRAAVRQAAAEGATEVLLAEHPDLADPPDTGQLLALLAAALREIAGETPLLLLLPAAPEGEELAARLAVRLGATPLGRCAAVRREGARVVARRPAYGGRAEAFVATEAPRCVAALRRPAERRAAAPDPEVPVRALDRGPAALPPAAWQVVSSAGRARQLQGARVVAAGGRGMGGAEGFALLEELALLLDGAVGASLPAVDAGWAGVAQQVGQSGTFVAPELYLAFGMSGTAQHLAGIGPRTRIVAVNPEPDADIFRFAELGLVAPWQEVLPRLVARLRAEEETRTRP
jgi:electron transfer flavoprotein alpha subunit